MSTRYSDAELKALRDGIAAGDSIAKIGRAIGRDRHALHARAVRDGLIERVRRYLTPEESALIIERYPHVRTLDLARELGMTDRMVYAHAGRMGLTKAPEFLASPLNGRIKRGERRSPATQFKPGNAAWNKGKPFNPGGRCQETRFKKGTRPHTWRPIGTERINSDGYLDRKVTDTGYPPRDWQPVHRLVWIEHHGEIPRGCVVVFKPGCRSAVREEITIDKLECVTRVELLSRNTIHNYPEDVVSTIRLRAQVVRLLNRKQRGAAP